MKISYYDLIGSPPDVAQVFNNRELGLAIWIFIFVICIIANKNLYEPALDVVRIVFCCKFIVIYICMLLYSTIMVYFLFRLGFWDLSLLKKTIMWFFFTAIISAFRAIGKAKDFSYFKTVLKDYIKITILLEFLINTYTFSLIGELILIPVLFIITSFNTVLDKSPEFQNEKSEPVKKLFWGINILLSLYIIINAFSMALTDLENLGTISNLKKMFLSPILSILFLGFIYAFALWASYEEIFVRIGFGETKSKSLIRYIKLRIITICCINLRKVNSFWRICGLKIMGISNKADAVEILNICEQLMLKIDSAPDGVEEIP